MITDTVNVQISDLSALADLICELDNRDKPPTLQNIEQCHALIIKMLGPHASLFYAADDGSEETAEKVGT